MFIISYGIMFILAPIILGQFFTAAAAINIADPAWAATYTETEGVIRYLVPLIPTIGIFILVIKVLMVASVRGRD